MKKKKHILNLDRLSITLITRRAKQMCFALFMRIKPILRVHVNSDDFIAILSTRIWGFMFDFIDFWIIPILNIRKKTKIDKIEHYF